MDTATAWACLVSAFTYSLSFWPYLVSFLLAFFIVWLDLNYVASDQVRHPINPCMCWGCLRFLVENGIIATVIYYVIEKGHIEVLAIPSLRFDGTWKDVITAAIAAPILSRTKFPVVGPSKLKTLKSGGTIEFSSFYSRKRDLCIRAIQNETKMHSRKILREFSDKFDADAYFIEDFAVIVRNALLRPRQNQETKKKLDEVDSIVATEKVPSGPDPATPAARGRSIQSLIRLALEEEDSRYILTFLRNRLRNKTPPEI